MGDIQGLMETVKDLKLDKQASLLKTLQTGIFTLRDLYQQFQTIMSMGPLSKVMGMLPGMSPEMLSAVGDEQGNNKLKTFMCIMDSMTGAELDSDAKVFYENTSRVQRVAIGSGTTVIEVQQLLMQYKMVCLVFPSMASCKSLTYPCLVCRYD
jgi:signal recognition particle subunit SRP54